MKYAALRFQHNLEKGVFDSTGQYDIPIIRAETFIPCEFIPFSNAKSSTKHANTMGIHFFIDDYKFERVWYDFYRYTEMLSSYQAVMTPDFSLYTDFPKALQIYNHYRKHFIGAYMQQMGMRVYPTISWSDKESLLWCFDGEPEHGTVCISSVGSQKNTYAKTLFKYGYDAMIERLQPETIIFYGTVPNDCKGNIIRAKAFQEKFTEVKTECI